MKKLFVWRNKPFYLKLRLLFGLAFFIIIAFFFWLRIIPSGQVFYRHVWPEKSFFRRGLLTDIRPGDRLDLLENDSLKIIAEPLYFSLFSPRSFNKVLVSVIYEDKLPIDNPIIELGLLKDRAAGAYEFESLQNSLIDKKRFSWNRLQEEDGIIVLQKDDSYQSAAAFWHDFNNRNLKSCPVNSLACVAFYNYPLSSDFSLPSYSELYPLQLEDDLRGGHELFVYFNDKPGNLEFVLKPRSGQENVSSLEARIRIYRDGKQLEEKTAAIPGRLDFFSSAAGLYKIELVANDTVVIDKIISSSDRLVFLNKIYFNEALEGKRLFTSAKVLSVSTSEANSLGELFFADTDFQLENTHDQVILKPKSAKNINEIRGFHGSLEISGNGVFSFSKDKLFDPENRQIDAFSELENYQYLVAAYKNPASRGNLKEAVAEFSLFDADYTDGKYSFVISIPGFKQDKGYDSSADINSYLAIKEISFKLTGKTLWQKIKELYEYKK